MFTRQGVAEGLPPYIKPYNEIYMYVINKLVQEINKNVLFYKVRKKNYW